MGAGRLAATAEFDPSRLLRYHSGPDEKEPEAHMGFLQTAACALSSSWTTTELSVSKKFLTDVIAQAAEVPATRANQLAADIIAAIKGEIIETGRFTLPDFGAFVFRETPKRTALNPRTGEKVAVKAGATVKFKASPSLNESALAGLKKAKRKAKKD